MSYYINLRTYMFLLLDNKCEDLSEQCPRIWNLPYWCHVSEFIRGSCRKSCGGCEQDITLWNSIYPFTGIYGYNSHNELWLFDYLCFILTKDVSTKDLHIELILSRPYFKRSHAISWNEMFFNSLNEWYLYWFWHHS